MGLLLVLSASPFALHAAMFNVRDHGAKGDGVADDAQAIQSAIKASATAGKGSTVLLSAGKYYMTRSPGLVPTGRY